MWKVEVIINGAIDLHAKATRWMAVLGFANFAGRNKLIPRFRVHKD